MVFFFSTFPAIRDRKTKGKSIVLSAENRNFSDGSHQPAASTGAAAACAPPSIHPFTRKTQAMNKKTITAGIVILLGLILIFTCPDRQAHQRQIRNTIAQAVQKEPPAEYPEELEPMWGLMSQVVVGKLADLVLDSQLEVNSYLFFSIGRLQLPDRERTVSFGILNHVFTFGQEDIQKSLKKMY